jgi:hypothetical protein
MARRGGKSGGGYEVGYGKPPRATQFAKGVSGNPRGRAKGAKNLATLLKLELARMIVITEDGRRRSIPKGEAAVKQLVNKAIGGEPRALALLLGASRGSEADEAETRPASSLGSTEDDMAVMANLIARLARRDEEDSE